MFTGLIQAVGRVRRKAGSLLVEGCQPFSPLTLGDSIAVDGVCLTVAELVKEGFLANISEETLNRTNLGKKADIGEFVNLEPALRLSDRLGGHLVSGHIDGLGRIVKIDSLKYSWQIEIAWQEKSFGRYICEKASISLDGVSLTVAGCIHDGSRFFIAVIPHTWENTTLQYLKIGSFVNLEIDLMAKYAESILIKSSAGNDYSRKSQPVITPEWLTNQGWT